MRSDERTDTTKVIFVFRDFVNAPKAKTNGAKLSVFLVVQGSKNPSPPLRIRKLPNRSKTLVTTYTLFAIPNSPTRVYR
jgi:hypothetical protein